MKGFATQLAVRDGTIEFIISRSEIQDTSPDNPLINEQASDGNSTAQVYLNDGALTYEYAHVDTGRATCSLPFDQFEKAPKLHIFLTWDTAEIKLHAGPHPPDEADELQTATASLTQPDA